MDTREQMLYMKRKAKDDEIVAFINAVIEEFKSQKIPKEEWPPIHYSFAESCIERGRSPEDAAWALLQ